MASNGNTPLIKEIAEKQMQQALQISDLSNKLDNAERGIQRILFILENDHGTGQEGLVAQVKEVRTMVEKHEMFKKNIEGKISMLAIFGGFVSGFVINVISKVFKV